MPQRGLAGAGVEATREGAAGARGDGAAHKEPDCAVDSALSESKCHEVILFWTIWCRRDPTPKKTRAEEPEPAMLQPAGEAGPSRVGHRSSCGSLG